VKTQIVVTGMGVVTGLGVGLDPFWTALRNGNSGVAKVSAFDVDGFPVRIACEVCDADLPMSLIRPRKALKLMGRSTVFAALAAEMARAQAGLGEDQFDPKRFGVVFGAGGMGAVDLEFLQAQVQTLRSCDEAGGFTWERFCNMYERTVNPLAPLRALPNSAAATIAILQGARGPNATVATACSSGTHAIGYALRELQYGSADVMIAGGTDAMVNPTGLLGFHLLGTLSQRNEDPEGASRPFDQDRDGFVIGEGAGVLVMEREDFARARGAPILGSVLGFGSSCDAYRMTDGREDGSGPAEAMMAAVQDADLQLSDIGYINAHGTGTELNDRVETLAIKAVFGGRAPPASSTKSMMGHLLAGAGAVEAVAAMLTLREGFLPPTINLDRPDPQCDLDYVPNIGRPLAVQYALSNSFGFGGQNACLSVSAPR
jgi:3-oxoacyl-[acyl-carrier-protein] synthase II